MRLKKGLKNNRAQSVLEYTLIFAGLLLALFASNFLGQVKGTFTSYFNDSVAQITGG